MLLTADRVTVLGLKFAISGNVISSLLIAIVSLGKGIANYGNTFGL